MLRYEPGEQGEWLAAAAPGRLLLVRTGASAPFGTDLWTSLAAGDGAETVLEELTRDGVFQTPSFALLTWDGPVGTTSLRTIVRGPVTLRLMTAAGNVEVTGRGVSTWSEQSFTAVSAFDVECAPAGPAQAVTPPPVTPPPGPAPAVTLPLLLGAVWTRRLSGTLDQATVAAPATPAPAAPAPAAPTLATSVPAAPTLATSVPATPVSPPGGVAEETLVEVTRVDPQGVPAPAVPGAAAPASRPGDDPAGYDHLFGATMMRGVEQAAVRAPETTETPREAAPEPESMHEAEPDAEPDAEPETGDHDGFTVMSSDVRKLRDSRERPARAPSARVPVGLYLLLPNGTHEPLAQPLLFGRSPSVSKVSGGRVPKLVSVGGGDQDISRNHARFALEGDTVVVTDLHSRNGTLVVLPGKSPQKLRQGEPTSIIVGTVVDLGGGITITVCED